MLDSENRPTGHALSEVQRRSPDGQPLPSQFRDPRTHALVERREDPVADAQSTTAEHDRAGIDEVDEVGDRSTDKTGAPQELVENPLLAGGGRKTDILGRQAARLREPLREERALLSARREAAHQAPSAGHGLEASGLSAAAHDRRIIGHLDVTDVAGGSGVTSEGGPAG